MLSFGVPLVVGVVIAVIVGIVVTLMFVLDVGREIRELLDSVREWWDDRRN